MKRTILIFALLVASQPLLMGVGVLTKWAIECGGGACVGTARAASPSVATRHAADPLAARHRICWPCSSRRDVAASRPDVTQSAPKPVPASPLCWLSTAPCRRDSNPTAEIANRLRSLIEVLGQTEIEENRAYGAADPEVADASDRGGQALKRRERPHKREADMWVIGTLCSLSAPP